MVRQAALLRSAAAQCVHVYVEISVDVGDCLHELPVHCTCQALIMCVTFAMARACSSSRGYIAQLCAQIHQTK
jgi:hypothetical protein